MRANNNPISVLIKIISVNNLLLTIIRKVTVRSEYIPRTKKKKIFILHTQFIRKMSIQQGILINIA